MSKELERAVERLLDECCRHCITHECASGNKNCPLFMDYYKLRTTIKNYDELNKDYSVVVNEKIALGAMYVKEHTIVGIIKNKGIDILKLKECARCITPSKYNKRTSYSYHKDLDQDEFDLAKEVLL